MSDVKSAAPKEKEPPAKHLFVASVEPFWSAVERQAGKQGFLGAWKEKRRMKRFVREANRLIVIQQGEPGTWDAKTGQPVCTFRIDRAGVLHDLREFAAKLEDKSYVSVLEGRQKTSFPHLLQSKERYAFYLPIVFDEPVWVSLDPDADPIPVGSSTKLARELESLNEELRVEETFKIRKMVDFFQASDKEIAKFESTADAQSGQFWVKFAYVLLSKLAHKSVENGLPIIFGS